MRIVYFIISDLQFLQALLIIVITQGATYYFMEVGLNVSTMIYLMLHLRLWILKFEFEFHLLCK